MNIETILICIINLLSFVIGAKIGQSIAKGKDITIDPIKATKDTLRERKIEKQEDLNKRQFETMMENIDKYDGTGLGQKKIPKN